MREEIEQSLRIVSNGLTQSLFDIYSFMPRRGATFSYNARLYLAAYHYTYFRGIIDTLLSEYACCCPYC